MSGESLGTSSSESSVPSGPSASSVPDAAGSGAAGAVASAPRAGSRPLIQLADEAGRVRYELPEEVAQGREGAVAAAVARADDLRAALRLATAALNKAGVDSPRADAELLAAHLLGEDRGRIAVRALMGEPVPAGFGELVQARADRVPLQHLTGTAPFRGLELAVGPGVFVPRPETELVAGAAIEEAARLTRPVVVDLCTGSGAIAAAVAAEVPAARVTAVELSDVAASWAGRNLADTDVRLLLGDARELPQDLDGAADVVVSNPPYVPAGRAHDAEAATDPATALYGGGADGMELPSALIARAATLLTDAGLLVMEHDETQEEAMRAALSGWDEVQVHRDLTGRIRFSTARRAARAAHPVGE